MALRQNDVAAALAARCRTSQAPAWVSKRMCAALMPTPARRCRRSTKNSAMSQTSSAPERWLFWCTSAKPTRWASRCWERGTTQSRVVFSHRGRERDPPRAPVGESCSGAHLELRACLLVWRRGARHHCDARRGAGMCRCIECLRRSGRSAGPRCVLGVRRRRHLPVQGPQLEHLERSYGLRNGWLGLHEGRRSNQDPRLQGRGRRDGALHAREDPRRMRQSVFRVGAEPGAHRPHRDGLRTLRLCGLRQMRRTVRGSAGAQHDVRRNPGTGEVEPRPDWARRDADEASCRGSWMLEAASSGWRFRGRGHQVERPRLLQDPCVVGDVVPGQRTVDDSRGAVKDPRGRSHEESPGLSDDDFRPGLRACPGVKTPRLQASGVVMPGP
jgi:hypothetical protein